MESVEAGVEVGEIGSGRQGETWGREFGYSLGPKGHYLEGFKEGSAGVEFTFQKGVTLAGVW